TSAGVPPLLLLGTQPRAVPRPVRPPAAVLVLRADPVGGAAAGDAAAVGVPAFPLHRRRRRGPPSQSGAGLLPAGRRLVRSFFFLFAGVRGRPGAPGLPRRWPWRWAPTWRAAAGSARAGRRRRRRRCSPWWAWGMPWSCRGTPGTGRRWVGPRTWSATAPTP